jgi:hypothetical protein
MALLNLFSKRQSRSRGEMPDVYVYNDLPHPLRVQIVHIIEDAFGTDQYGTHYAERAYKFIKDSLCREYGLFEPVGWAGFIKPNICPHHNHLHQHSSPNSHQAARV